MKNVIVTGGLGFIGSNLIKLLHKKNYFVINIDKVSYSSNFSYLKKIKYYKFYKANINNFLLISDIIKKYKPKFIFNLAAETHVDRSIDRPLEFIKSNYLGLFNLIEIIRKNKLNVKLIHVSTDEVYGDIKKKKKSKENDTYNPSSPYSSTKAGADLLIKSYVKTFGLPITITRSCNNYGPNQYPEKLIPTIIYKIFKNEPIPIYGKGKNEREWIYVKDNCEAILKVAEKGKVGEIYNIGSKKIFTNLQVAKKIIAIIGKGKIKFVIDRPGHDMRYCLNSNKIKKEIDWTPKTGFNKGLKITIKWYFKKFRINFYKKKIGKRQGIINEF